MTFPQKGRKFNLGYPFAIIRDQGQIDTLFRVLWRNGIVSSCYKIYNIFSLFSVKMLGIISCRFDNATNVQTCECHDEI